MTRFVLPLTLAAALLSGCATAPIQHAASVTVPAAFAGTTAAGTPAIAPQAGAWWLVFNDPVLNTLESQATTGNGDIRIAAARLDQARALLKSARADLWPQAGASFGTARTTDQQPYPKAVNASTLGLDLSYEVDIFGRLSKASQASRLDADASAALAHDTQLLIQSRVAQSYFALRALDEDRNIVGDTLGAYRTSLQVTQKRFQEGDVAQLDVARLETEVASTEAEALALDQQRANVAHALSVLVGEPATTFNVTSGAWAQQPWADAVPVIPAGLPSDVLQRRPDIIAANASVEAAQKRVGIARAAWFPTLSLTASGGYASTDLGSLFDEGSETWSLAAILSQAVFDGGRRNAGIDYAKGNLDVAFAGYQQQVLVAFADVEDQLSDLGYLRQQQTAEDQAVDAATRALQQSQSRYRNGSSSQLEVLDAQRSQLAIRRNALRVRAAQYQSTVGLIRAIGGGWQG